MGDFNRRTVLAAASAVAATGGAALAQAPAAPPARQKGPRVWLDMDQQELDDAYDQSKYAPNLRQVVGRYATNSEQVRARLGAPKRLAYGPTPIEGLDLYTAKQPNAPVHIFIHGGTWRTGPRNGLSVSRRDVPACRRAFYLARFHQRARRQGRPGADGRSGAPRGRLDLQERRELRRRSEPALSLRPFVGRASRGRRAGDRLGEGLRRAERRAQGRPVLLRHVRHEGGDAVGALELSQDDRRDDPRDVGAAPPRQDQLSGHRRLRHAGDAGIPAPEPRLRGGRQGGGQTGHAAGRPRDTTTSRSSSCSPIPTACSGARRWSR